jgi:hypothetical protein
MVKAIFSTLLFFSLSTLNATSAESKTALYCETTQILKTDQHEMFRPKNEKFRMVVSNDIVEFGINGFTGGTNSFKVSNYKKVTDWQSDYDRFYILFLNEDFYFSAVFPHSSRAVSAKCKLY